jgi:hypothetical protein
MKAACMDSILLDDSHEAVLPPMQQLAQAYASAGYVPTEEQAQFLSPTTLPTTIRVRYMYSKL